MRILRASAHRRMPWKNGGGETIEIAVHPPGAGLADFDWRVLTARVAGDGPFSVFEGVDRTLSLFEGEGIVLHIAGMSESTLLADGEPLCFPADAPTGARLLGGPILDLNVMTRRGIFDHQVRHLMVGERRIVCPAVRWTFILPLGPVTVEAADETVYALRSRDVLVPDGDDAPLKLQAPPRSRPPS